MVESVALEMRSAGTGTEGSNPSLSSSFTHFRPMDRWQAAPDSSGTAAPCYILNEGVMNAPTITPIRMNSATATMTTIAV